MVFASGSFYSEEGKLLPPQLLFCASCIADGNMSTHLEAAEKVHRNRATFLQRLELLYETIIVDPRHTSNVAVALGADFRIRNFPHPVWVEGKESASFYDAVLFDLGERSAGVISADCIPAFFVSVSTGLACLAHVGLLGLANGIVFNVLRSMEEHGARSRDLRVLLGPSISGDDYIVSQSGLWNAISSQLLVKHPRAENFIRNNGDDELCFDLVAAFCDQATNGGVRRQNIARPSYYTDGRKFFSHQSSKLGHGPRGNLLTVAGLSAGSRVEGSRGADNLG
ncbi:polyphenol oxidase family protein [Ensifer sp. IC4062]|nr:polyphenol oxidase family protein [Ensifer sp. IC4062]